MVIMEFAQLAHPIVHHVLVAPHVSPALPHICYLMEFVFPHAQLLLMQVQESAYHVQQIALNALVPRVVHHAHLLTYYQTALVYLLVHLVHMPALVLVLHALLIALPVLLDLHVTLAHHHIYFTMEYVFQHARLVPTKAAAPNALHVLLRVQLVHQQQVAQAVYLEHTLMEAAA